MDRVELRDVYSALCSAIEAGDVAREAMDVLIGAMAEAYITFPPGEIRRAGIERAVMLAREPGAWLSSEHHAAMRSMLFALTGEGLTEDEGELRGVEGESDE